MSEFCTAGRWRASTHHEGHAEAGGQGRQKGVISIDFWTVFDCFTTVFWTKSGLLYAERRARGACGREGGGGGRGGVFYAVFMLFLCCFVVF